MLGIDDVVLLSILVDKLPKRERETARSSVVARAADGIALLFMVSWLVGLNHAAVGDHALGVL